MDFWNCGLKINNKNKMKKNHLLILIFIPFALIGGLSLSSYLSNKKNN